MTYAIQRLLAVHHQACRAHTEVHVIPRWPTHQIWPSSGAVDMTSVLCASSHAVAICINKVTDHQRRGCLCLQYGVFASGCEQARSQHLSASDFCSWVGCGAVFDVACGQPCPLPPRPLMVCGGWLSRIAVLHASMLPVQDLWSCMPSSWKRAALGS